LYVQADVTIRATVCSKLQIIAEQVHFLQQQAHKVLLDAKENLKLHHAACNFHKIPGHIYHLYERSSGQWYFSMLSPEVGYAHSTALCIVVLAGAGGSDVVTGSNPLGLENIIHRGEMAFSCSGYSPL
jgi:hypothetical protein